MSNKIIYSSQNQIIMNKLLQLLTQLMI